MHRVIAELDARGQIDGHAAMCLRQAIHETRGGATALVLVDLRDLTEIDAAGLELLRGENAGCHAHGLTLGLLINDGERQARLAEAFVLAGLGDTLHLCAESPVPAPPDRDRRRRRARDLRGWHLGRAQARWRPRRPGASRPT